VTDSKRGAGFSYTFEFKHPGSFYYLELEYPDNSTRIIEVVIKSMANASSESSSQAGVGAETGGRYLPTGKMQTLRWIHVADPGKHQVDVVNTMNGERSAAKSLKIYRIKGDLPALVSGPGRTYGIHSERCFYDSGIGKNFGTIALTEDGKVAGRGRPGERIQAESLMQAALKNLHWLKLTGERYVQYLKYTGQNAHIMGTYQYCEYNTPNIFAPPVEDSSILNCPKTMMANLFDANGIDFYAGIEFSQSQDVKTYANNAQVAQGADSAYMISEDGRQIYGFFVSYLQNWMYPETQQKFYSLMQRTGRTYGHLSHFRGIHNFTGIDSRAGGYWMPSMSFGSKYDDPLRISFDDTTFKRFEEETGIKTNVAMDDPKRFAKRAKFIKGNAEIKATFLAWRADKFKEMMAEAVAALRQESRPDAQLLNVLQMPDNKLFEYLYKSKKDCKELCGELGYDIDKVNSIDGIWTGRWTIGWRHSYPRPPHRNPYTWMARTDKNITSAFDRDHNRFVFVRTSWDENNYEGGRIRILPQPSGYNSREALIQALITGDPELIVGGYTDLNINVGYEHILRQILLPFTYLPKANFTPVLNTGLTTNVAIRQLNQQDASYFYLANPGQWAMSGSLTLAGGGEVFDLVTGKQLAAGTGELEFTLEPFGLLAYRVTSPNLKITAYKTNPLAQDDLAMLQGAVDIFAQDVMAGKGISAAEKSQLEPVLAKIYAEIDKQEYAQAWAMLTEPGVWNLKQKTEKE
ncbi:MAG: hypothetical protein JXA52_07375, partial [Planctomycetes bacterium]|nr:hypothetical protein [Planctomycetota bacterium]